MASVDVICHLKRLKIAKQNFSTQIQSVFKTPKKSHQSLWECMGVGGISVWNMGAYVVWECMEYGSV